MKLKIGKIQEILEKFSILLNKLKEFSEKLKDFFLNSRCPQLELVTVAEKRPKKACDYGHAQYEWYF